MGLKLEITLVKSCAIYELTAWKHAGKDSIAYLKSQSTMLIDVPKITVDHQSYCI
jgi:hypothetical protein